MKRPLSSKAWRQLRAEFQSVTERLERSTKPLLTLKSWNYDIAGADEPLRFYLTQLVTRAGLGLGASLDQAVATWIDAVRRHLDARGSSLLSRGDVDSYVGPKIHVPVRLAQLRDAAGRVVTRATARRRARALTPAERRRPLEVVPDGDAYRVADNPAEYRRFMAHLAVHTDLVWCAVPNPHATGDVLVTVVDEIDRLDLASAELCLDLETRALAVEATEAAAASGTAGGRAPFQLSDHDLNTKLGRRRAMAAFLDESSAIAKAQVSQSDVWRALGHRRSRTLLYWLANTPPPKGTKRTDERVRQLLGRGPRAFVDLLKNQQRLAPKSRAPY